MSAYRGSWTLEIPHPNVCYEKNTPTELGTLRLHQYIGHTESPSSNLNKISLLLHTGFGLLVGFWGTLQSGHNSNTMYTCFNVVCAWTQRGDKAFWWRNLICTERQVDTGPQSAAAQGQDFCIHISLLSAQLSTHVLCTYLWSPWTLMGVSNSRVWVMDGSIILKSWSGRKLAWGNWDPPYFASVVWETPLIGCWGAVGEKYSFENTFHWHYDFRCNFS